MTKIILPSGYDPEELEKDPKIAATMRRLMGTHAEYRWREKNKDVLPRAEALAARFNGLIKYLPILRDECVPKFYRGAPCNEPWSDDKVFGYAMMLHAFAHDRLRVALLEIPRSLPYASEDKKVVTVLTRLALQRPRWNDGIPYCRNFPKPEHVAEARK